MMSRNSIKKIYAVALLLLLTGCDQYLEKNPDNRVDLNSVEKASQLLTNAYSNAGYTFNEWMADNVNYTSGSQKLNNHNQAYAWLEFTGIDQDTPANFWTSTYDAIAHANEVLAIIDDLPGDEARKNAVKGEALLTRAYGHFMLVNLFAQHYDKDHADDDLGIPYVKEPETEFIKKYTRLTVEEVYDEIEEDLEDGLDLVDGSFYANSGKYHFTKNAALAFASRFYLYKGELSNCIKYSNELLGSNPGVFVKDLPTIQRDKINTDDYLQLYHSPTDESNLLMMRQISNFHLPNYGFWLSSDRYNELRSNPFQEDDLRMDPAWVAGNDDIALAKYEFLFERTSITSNVGYNYTIFLAFRAEEVLLNRAECYILQSNLGLALADLQALASKRYLGDPVVDMPTLKSYYGNGNDLQIAYIYLQEERIKEFMHEGLRWFDIKRYELGVEHFLSDGTKITLSRNDDRKAIQIPQAAITVGGLEPNPE